jgi:protease-4
MDENVKPPGFGSEPSAASSSASAPPPLRQVPPPAFQPPPFVQTRRSSGRGWKVFALILAGLLVFSWFVKPFLSLLVGGGGESMLSYGQETGPQLQERWIENNHSANRIVVVPVEGVITSQSMGRGGPTMVDVIKKQLERAADDKHVKAVVLKVNSPGGEVLASDDIYRLIEDFQAHSGKPVVASMGSLAASGGYYVSAPCRWIVANELTITGSIGVIMHGYNFRGLMDKVGVRPQVFKSGKYKDMLSFDKRDEDITIEERQMVQGMIDETFQKFKSVVAEGRTEAAKLNKNAGKPLVNDWAQYADGRILSGTEALKHGFVDELGNLETALARARKIAGIEDASVIEYQPLLGLGDLLGLIGKSEAPALKIDMGLDIPRLELGRMYFICPLTLPR